MSIVTNTITSSPRFCFNALILQARVNSMHIYADHMQATVSVYWSLLIIEPVENLYRNTVIY